MPTRAALRAAAQRLLGSGDLAAAIGAHAALLQAHPDEPDAWFNLGWLQQQARRWEAAVGAYRQALAHGLAAPADAHVAIAALLAQALDRPHDAEAELRHALAHDPRHVAAWLNLGNLAEQRGERSLARQAYEQVLAVEPAHALALARLAGLGGDDAPALIPRLQQALQRPGLADADVADLGFALGRLLDGEARTDEAFACFARANAASRRAQGAAPYDRAAHEALVDRLIDAFPAAEAAPRADGAPVFVCGMFRSGTSLVEQILASHPDVAPGGEIDTLPIAGRALFPLPPAPWVAPSPEALQGLKRAYEERLAPLRRCAPVVTDKRPDNVLNLGLIQRLYPGARIVHTRREPVDNCLAVWFAHLGPALAYAYDLEDTAHWYSQQQRLMDHWRRLHGETILDVDYDTLVADPEPVVRALLAHCGLPWNDACLAFHRTPAAVRTPSAWQVREPLYRHASGRWRRYERHLGPLRAALGV